MNLFLRNKVAMYSNGTAAATLLLALAGCGTGPVGKGPENIGFSGHELSDGKRAGAAVTGLLFAGNDNQPCDCWTGQSTGGNWIASINYTGQAGLGSAVTVTGGKWSWLDADDVIKWGRITGGAVTWPSTLDSDSMKCGAGVARLAITLTVAGESADGSFKGCLDDTHLDPRRQPFVFPPKIWGTLSFERD